MNAKPALEGQFHCLNCKESGFTISKGRESCPICNSPNIEAMTADMIAQAAIAKPWWKRLMRIG